MISRLGSAAQRRFLFFFCLFLFFFFSFLNFFLFLIFILPDAEEPEILWLTRVFIGEIYISIYVGCKAALGKGERPAAVLGPARP